MDRAVSLVEISADSRTGSGRRTTDSVTTASAMTGCVVADSGMTDLTVSSVEVSADSRNGSGRRTTDSVTTASACRRLPQPKSM